MNDDMNNAVVYAMSQVQANENKELVGKLLNVAGVSVTVAGTEEALRFISSDRQEFSVSLTANPLEECARFSNEMKNALRPNVVVREIDLSSVIVNDGSYPVKRKRGENPYMAHIDELGYFKGPEKQIVNVSNGVTTSFLNDCDVQNPPTNVKELMNPDAPKEAATEANNEPQTDRTRLYKDEEWQREGNNKKWRRPGIDAQRKKMAKASKKRNRR